MQTARYLPAHKVKAGSLRLGRLSVRSADDREIGKLLGFVIEPRAPRIRSLVVECDDAQLEVPMRPVRFDPLSRSLRLVEGASSTVAASRFSPESVPEIDENDLWVPLYGSAA
ncbi:MAG TPA: hypothetical protein VH740_24915 [Vicinamibacterales bacterium]|jgi:hypothetical protein